MIFHLRIIPVLLLVLCSVQVLSYRINKIEPVQQILYQFDSDKNYNIQVKAYGLVFFISLQFNDLLLHEDFYHVDYDDGKIHICRGFVSKVESASFSDSNSGHSSISSSVPFSDDLNWARFVVNGDEFDGSFKYGDEIYSVKTFASYKLSKHNDDASFSQDVVLPKLNKEIVFQPLQQQQNFPQKYSSSSTLHIAFRHSDIYYPPQSSQGNKSACGSESLYYNIHMADRSYQDMLDSYLISTGQSDDIFKRDAGCPTAKKILYMYVAGDCSYVSNYGGTSKALQQILSDWNQASAVYERTFNIALGVNQVNLQQNCGNSAWNHQCSSQYTISQRLSDFTKWKSSQNIQAGLFSLMTRCNTDVTVGISWLGLVCQNDVISQPSGSGSNDYVSNTGVISITPNEWLVVAHEIGHSFGARHDCTADTCSQCSGTSCPCCPCSGSCDCHGQFIMNPTSDVGSNNFSPCSISTICGKLPVVGKCLLDPGSLNTIASGVCGNGIKEEGEDCDCGPASSSSCTNNPCCDGSTCKFKNGAKCSDNNDLCCQNCQLQAQGTVCRPARGMCDQPEQCPGTSGDCPADSYLDDLTSCTLSDGTSGQCASGDCTNRDLQCKLKGSSNGVTGECPGYSDQCQMYCQGSDLGACLEISGYFVDGSPCAYKGKCVQGYCQADAIGKIIGWGYAHVGAAVSILVVLCVIFLCCVGRCVQICLSRKRMRTAYPPTPGTVPNYPAGVFLNARTSHQQSNAPTYWVDPSIYNGAFSEDEGIKSLSEREVQQMKTSRPTSLKVQIPSVVPPREYINETNNQRSSSISPTRTSALPRSARLANKKPLPIPPPEVDKDS